MDPQPNRDNEDVLIDTICVGCDIPLVVNDLGLCAACYAKLEHDLIRARDWDYSGLAFGAEPDQYEVLREQIIRDYGSDYELPAPPAGKPKRKNKRSHSRTTQRKREIAARAIRDYSTEDVLEAARQFIQQPDEAWVNFSRVSQHLYETFYKLKPKHLGSPDKKYKSLFKFLADYPDSFEWRMDKEKPGVYWIRAISHSSQFPGGVEEQQ